MRWVIEVSESRSLTEQNLETPDLLTSREGHTYSSESGVLRGLCSLSVTASFVRGQTDNVRGVGEEPSRERLRLWRAVTFCVHVRCCAGRLPLRTVCGATHIVRGAVLVMHWVGRGAATVSADTRICTFAGGTVLRSGRVLDSFDPLADDEICAPLNKGFSGKTIEYPPSFNPHSLYAFCLSHLDCRRCPLLPLRTANRGWITAFLWFEGSSRGNHLGSSHSSPCGHREERQTRPTELIPKCDFFPFLFSANLSTVRPSSIYFPSVYIDQGTCFSSCSRGILIDVNGGVGMVTSSDICLEAQSFDLHALYPQLYVCCCVCA